MSARKKAEVIDLNAARRRLRTCQPKVFAGGMWGSDEYGLIYDHQPECPEPALCDCRVCQRIAHSEPGWSLARKP